MGILQKGIVGTHEKSLHGDTLQRAILQNSFFSYNRTFRDLPRLTVGEKKGILGGNTAWCYGCAASTLEKV